MWEIEARRALASLVPDDSGTVHFLGNHTDTGTTHVLEIHVSTGIVHVRMDMTTEDRIRQRNGDPTILPWTQ